MKLKILAVVVLAAVGVGAVVSSTGLLTPAAAATRYLTAAATTGDVTEDVAATGTLAAQARYGLAFGSAPFLVTAGATAPAAQDTWPVTDVLVSLGDAVSAGDILARADPSALEQSLATAINRRKSAAIDLRAARATLDDADENGTTAQIRQAKSSLLNAENQAAQAVQDVADLRTRIAAATLVAPVDGVVTETNVSAGFDAPTGSAIVIDAAGFQVTTDVVERDLADVKVGQPATVTVSAVGEDLEGIVSTISPVANTASGTGVVSYPVTVTVETLLPALRAGMSADVTITIASAADVLTVPAEALRGNAGNYSVLIIAADGSTAAQPVDVGLVTSTSAEITSGLVGGQLVVTGIDTPTTGTATTTGGGFGGVAIPGGGFGGGRGTGGQGGQGRQP